MTKKLKYILLLLLAHIASIHATGPSYINIQITPIARNTQGDILCRTSLEKNNMGGHNFNYIDYGLCVISQDSIIEYPLVYELKGEEIYKNHSIEVFEEYYDQWQNWVMGKNRDLIEAEKELAEKYKFKELLADEYLNNDTISLIDFADKYTQKGNIALHSLSNGKADLTETPYSSKNIIVTHDFGNIVFTQNESMCDDEDLDFGYEFDYLNPIFDNDANYPEGMGYEMYHITGIYFVDETK